MLIRRASRCKRRRRVVPRPSAGTWQARAALCWAAVPAQPVPMRTIRIHVDQPLAVSGEPNLPPQAAEHVARVLRMNPGDPLTLFNGDGHDYAAVIVAVGKREVTVRVESKQALQNESPLPLTLAQGVARGEKMDLIVQKATELGVARIVPLLTERSEVRLDASRADGTGGVVARPGFVLRPAPGAAARRGTDGTRIAPGDRGRRTGGGARRRAGQA